YTSSGQVVIGPAWGWQYPDHGDGAQWAAFGWYTDGWESINSGTTLAQTPYANSCLRTDYYDWSTYYGSPPPGRGFRVSTRITSSMSMPPLINAISSFSTRLIL